VLKDLLEYPRRERLKALRELEKDADWNTLPTSVRTQKLILYLNKKRALARARSSAKAIIPQ